MRFTELLFMQVQRWTIAAKECYDRGCICNGCFYKENMETRCQMKLSVRELVKKFGKPPDYIEHCGNGRTIYKYEDKENEL